MDRASAVLSESLDLMEPGTYAVVSKYYKVSRTRRPWIEEKAISQQHLTLSEENTLASRPRLPIELAFESPCLVCLSTLPVAKFVADEIKFVETV